MVLLKTLAMVAFAFAVTTPALAETVNASLRVSQENEALFADARAWIVGIIEKAAPPGRKVYYPEGQETVEEARQRYNQVADDIIRVVYSPSTKPLFTGPNGRARTVSVILSVMLHESGFMRHVDFGLGKYARGDHGESWCSMQIRVGTGRTMKWNTKHDRPVEWNDPAEEVFLGYKGEELIANRQTCISEGLRVLRVSFGGTKGMPLDDRLRIYASGNRDKGAEASKNRMRTAMRFFSATSKVRSFKDEDLMTAVVNERRTLFLGLPPVTSAGIM